MSKLARFHPLSFSASLLLSVLLSGCDFTSIGNSIEEGRANLLISKAHESRDAKDYRQSVDTLKQAASLAPKYARVWYELCNAYAYTGEYDLAIQACQQNVSLEPTAGNYNFLGWSYWPRHDYVKAASVFELAIAKSDDPIYQDHYLWSLLGAKEYDKAIPVAQRLIEKITKDKSPSVRLDTTYECLGVAYAATGQTSKAQAAFRDAGVESCSFGFVEKGQMQVSCKGLKQ
ncbi:MAG: tetratricopeptide repeat protein [Terracidiphilus sp.]|jgi:tetratricopeptide (TPR) repeat protein